MPAETYKCDGCHGVVAVPHRSNLDRVRQVHAATCPSRRPSA